MTNPINASKVQDQVTSEKCGSDVVRIRMYGICVGSGVTLSGAGLVLVYNTVICTGLGCQQRNIFSQMTRYGRY